MVSCHMLSELEEVIQYKLVPERREIIRQIWWERLQVSLVGSPNSSHLPLLFHSAYASCLLTGQFAATNAAGSSLRRAGRMRFGMAVNAAQHKIVNLPKTL